MLKLNYAWLKTNDTHPVKCCLCQGKYPPEEKTQFSINNKIFKIKKCLKDNLFFLSPQPGLKYAQSLYNHPSYYQGLDDMYGLLVDDERSAEIAQIRIKEIRRYASRARSILEIGCGYGHLLEAVSQSGFIRADGLELSKSAVDVCKKKGLNVVLADDKRPYQNKSLMKSYDVIAMYSVLEHLENPLIFLKKIRGFVSLRGILVIRVPDTDSQEGPRLSLVDHLWHFTRISLVKVLKRAGFEVKDIFASGVFQGLAHEGQVKNMTAIAIKKSSDKHQ